MGYPDQPGGYGAQVTTQHVDTQQFPPHYQIARWTLVGFLGVQIILLIVAGVVGGNTIKDSGEYSQDVKDIAVGFIWGIVGVSILITMLGFFGAIRNHYCMTMGYAITMTVLGLIALFNVGKYDGAMWGQYVFGWFVTFLAYYVAIQIRKINGGVTIVYA